MEGDHSEDASEKNQEQTVHSTGGWGGWFSAPASSSAPVASGWGFGSILSTVAESAQSIASVATKIIVPEVEETRKEEGNDETVADEAKATGDEKNQDEETLQIDPLATIGSIVGTSVSVFGNFVQSVQSNTLVESFTETVGVVAQSSFEASKQVVSSVAETIEGSTIYEHGVDATKIIAIQSLDAVEFLGKKAMDILIPHPLENVDDSETLHSLIMEPLMIAEADSQKDFSVGRAEIRPAAEADEKKSGEDQALLTYYESIPDLSFQVWSDKLKGTDELKKLDLMSNDCLLRSRKLGSTKVPTAFDEIFNTEDAYDTECEAPKEGFVGYSSLSVLDGAKLQSQDLMTFITQQLAKVSSSDDDALVREQADRLFATTSRSVKKALADYAVAVVLEMSTYLEKQCELSLNPSGGITPDISKTNAESYRAFVLFVNNALTDIAELHVAVLRHIGATLKACENPVACVDEVVEKSRAITASMYVESSNAYAIVQKAFESSHPVFQWIWLNASSKN